MTIDMLSTRRLDIWPAIALDSAIALDKVEGNLPDQVIIT
jgi:hypothetical protein